MYVYVSIFRASLAEPCSLERLARYRATGTRSRLVPPDYIILPSPKGLGDDLGRHFLKREGALIRYPCALVHFFTDFFSLYPRRKK